MRAGKKWAANWFDIVNYTGMTLFSLSILFPFWDMLVLSLSDPRLSSLTLRLWPKGFTVESYLYAFRNDSILLAYLVSIYRTVFGTLLTLLLISLAAFTLSKRDLPLRNVATTLILIPMFFGGGMIPTYIVIRYLGLIDHLLVYILPGAVSIFSLLILRNYFMSLDQALEESAFMDGAGYMTVLFRIVMPLSKPVLATVALWSMVGHWNAWFDSLIYIRDDNKIVLQLLLQKLVKASGTADVEMMAHQLQSGIVITTKSLQAAVTMITIGPIVVLYPFLQKYFVKGIMIGSLKG